MDPQNFQNPSPDQAPQAPISPQPPSQPKSPLAWLLGIAVILILALIGGYWWLSRDAGVVVLPPAPEKPLAGQVVTEEPVVTPTVPADWKIYRNEEYGFEMGYPASWTLDNKKYFREYNNSYRVVDLSLRPEQGGGSPGAGAVWFKSLSDLETDLAKPSGTLYSTMQNITMDGELGSKRTFQAVEISKGTEYIFPSKQLVFYFADNYSEDVVVKQALLDIAASIKFINYKH